MNRRMFALGSLVIAASMILTACGGAAPAPTAAPAATEAPAAATEASRRKSPSGMPMAPAARKKWR